MKDVLFGVSFVVFAVASVVMVISIFTPRFALGSTKTKLRSFFQWFAISVVSLILTGVFVRPAQEKEQPVAAAPEPASASVAAAPAPAPAPVQRPTARDSLKKVKEFVSVEPMTLNDGRPALRVLYREMKPFTKSLYVEAIPLAIWTALRAADPGDRAEIGALVVDAEGPVIDGYGHETTAQVFRFVVMQEDLAKFNWASTNHELLMNYALVTNKTQVGRTLIDAYCGSDRIKRFCASGRQ